MIIFFTSASCAGDIWSDFINKPDYIAYQALESNLKNKALKCKTGNTCPKDISACPPNIMPTSVQNFELDKMVDANNEFALKSKLLIYQCIDGAESEDFDRHVGIFFENSPQNYLRIVQQMQIPDKVFLMTLTMLPESTVDHINMQIKQLTARLKLLQKINSPKLNYYKKIGIERLTKKINELKNIK